MMRLPSGDHVAIALRLESKVSCVLLFRANSCTQRSECGGLAAERENATRIPSGERARALYPLRSPTVPRALPARSNQISSVGVLAPPIPTPRPAPRFAIPMLWLR